jgi:hypothetical protein
MPPVPYDRRFFAVFVTQLEERAWPRFPSGQWWAALRFADREQEYVRPVNGHGPLMSQKVQLKGDPPRDADWKTLSLVKTACDRWWRRYGRL